MHYGSSAFAGIDECKESLKKQGYYVASCNIFDQILGLDDKDVMTLENMIKDPSRASRARVDTLSDGETAYIKIKIKHEGFGKEITFKYSDANKVPSHLYDFSGDSSKEQTETPRLMPDEKEVIKKMASSVARVIEPEIFAMKVYLLLNNQPELKKDPYHHNISDSDDEYSPEYIILGVLDHNCSWNTNENHLGSTQNIPKQKIGVVNKDHLEKFSENNYKEDSDSKRYRYVDFKQQFEEKKGAGYIIDQISPLINSGKIIVHQREPRKAPVASRLTAEIRIFSLERHPEAYKINDKTTSDFRSFISTK
jgi:hypothetical protein